MLTRPATYMWRAPSHAVELLQGCMGGVSMHILGAPCVVCSGSEESGHAVTRREFPEGNVLCTLSCQPNAER